MRGHAFMVVYAMVVRSAAAKEFDRRTMSDRTNMIVFRQVCLGPIEAGALYVHQAQSSRRAGEQGRL